ncbi:hypothetical protein CRUP_038290 [Coryphaenoides rupestris]|nr:hypothetical protein CRUP_038290 [Coryphaenoides rupestris]
MKLLKINGTTVERISETRIGYIPFRESKLTKLFQAFFCGRGKASMIVNINQCASTYDETLHVMKFSAIAKQVVQLTPVNSLGSPCLVDRDGNPLLRTGALSEEDLLDEEDEADVSILPQEDLLTVIENLRSKLLAERKKNMGQEMEIRNEMGDAMLQQLIESEERFCRQMVELRESYDEKLENTFDMYKDAFKEHAYQCARDRIGEDYVPIDEFIAEEEKVEEQVATLSQKSPVKTKPKRGLLANIRDTVTSPRSAMIGRTLRKTIRATPTPGKKHNG